jgi:ABC-2 type transport system permease protein
MAESGWPQHALSVGVFEFRRSVRAIWQDKGRFALMVLGELIPSLMVAVFVVVFAETIRGIETLHLLDQLRGSIALFWLFAVFMITQRVVSARTRIEAEPLMLTTVSARTVAGGLLVAETLRGLAYLGLPVLVLTGTGVFLFGALVSLILVPAAAVLFTATAVITGAVVGYAVAWLVATSPFVARHKTVLGSAASLIGMGGYFLFFFPQIGGVSQAALAWLPIGWFADLAMIGTGLMDASFRSVGVLLSSVVLLLGGGAIVERETTALWFIEPVSVDTEDTTRAADVGKGKTSPRSSRRDALAAAVKPLAVPRVVPTPVRRVAEWALLRTRREPNRLTFLIMPVAGIGSAFISTGIQSGALRTLAAPVCAVLLPWLAGSLFALNPFGDEGVVLPMTLTAVSGKQYVRGLMVPGLVLGLPVVLVVTTIAGVVSPYTLFEQVSLVVLSGYLTCVSVAMTPAIGMAFPRFSAISIGQSQEVLPPRMSAAILHLAMITLPGALLVILIISPKIARIILAGLVGTLPAFLFGLLTDAAGGLFSTAAAWFAHVSGVVRTAEVGHLQVVAGGALLICGVFVAVLLYRNAVHRFERYSPV